MLRRLLLVLLAAGLAFVSLPAAAAEPVFPPGLRIGLTPPGEARVSIHFPGFEDADRKVAITILDLPARAYARLEAAAYGKQRGLDDMKRESFPFDNGIGLLVSGHAQVNGVTVYKWLLLAQPFGGPVQDLTSLVNVSVPEAARAIYTDAAIRQALTSVTFRPTPVKEQLGLLPFKLGDMGGFRVMQVLPDGGVILTEGPTDNINVQPYMIVSIGRGGPAEPRDRGRFARELLDAAPLREIRLQLSEPMRINGAAGHEVRASAKSLNGDALSLVQWLRFGAGGFMRIVGVSRTDAWDSLFPRFRAVRDGIEAK